MSYFDVIVPSGWIRIDPRETNAALIDEIARVLSLRAFDENRGLVHSALRSTLTESIAALSAAGSLMALMSEPTSPLSLYQPIVSFSRLDWAADVEPLSVLMAIAAKDPSAQVYPLDVAIALRTHATASISQNELSARVTGLGVVSATAREADFQARQGLAWTRESFRYWIGLPSNREAWVEATCVATVPHVPDQPDPTPLLQETFDALLSTFEWMS